MTTRWRSDTPPRRSVSALTLLALVILVPALIIVVLVLLDRNPATA